MAPGVAPTVNLTPVQQQGPPNGDMMGGYAGGEQQLFISGCGRLLLCNCQVSFLWQKWPLRA
jgi:hypothetical protein